ncbi:MAG: winged-helix transcriptional response regulator [Bacteroidetes bacterium]|jgi:heavy metal response regulator|nr:winged-helix transcriptional response regulator [Bacteroidota bacterium]
MRILVVEDEKKVARFIQQALEEERYTVDVAFDGEEGERLALEQPYDLLVLDVMLPKKSGIELTRAHRAGGRSTPILMLTAKTAVDDRVEGLDSGADDYLTKPFAVAELLARVRSLLRRGASEKSTILSIADLELDTVTHKARRGGKAIDLTVKEYSLLEFLLRNKERVLSRTVISEHIWDYSFDTGTNLIDVYVNHLRNKVDTGHPTKLIHTVRGVGYVMREE